MRPGKRNLRVVGGRRPSPTLRFWPEQRPGPWRWSAVALRPFLLLIVLVSLWLGSDPRLIPPVGPIAGEPERVDQSFTRCGPGRGYACVIDGDTLRLGDRKIRIADINAPELAEPQCPAEAALARQSRQHLLELLNRGAFTMTANRLDPTDRYGRELRHLDRGGVSLGEAMIDAKMAHPYRGALETGWC